MEDLIRFFTPFEWLLAAAAGLIAAGLYVFVKCTEGEPTYPASDRGGRQGFSIELDGGADNGFGGDGGD